MESRLDFGHYKGRLRHTPSVRTTSLISEDWVAYHFRGAIRTLSSILSGKAKMVRGGAVSFRLLS
jgi:hypothetical protein